MAKKQMDLEYSVSAHLAYWHANDFKTAAGIIYDKKVSKPVVVNLAFACELYMKALLIRQRKSQKVVIGHELDALFSELDEETRNTVLRESKIRDWEGFIKESSNAFESWRYYYEKDRIMVGQIPELFRLAEVLDSICREIFDRKEL